VKVLFLHSDKPRERILAEAFIDGLKTVGDEGVKRPLQHPIEVDTSVEAVCMVGVKSRELFRAYGREGIRVLYFDKGYSRHKSLSVTRSWEYWRVSSGAHHPSRYLMGRPFPSDRWERMGFELKPWREHGGHIVFAGSSAKYHEFYDLPEPTTYAQKMIKRIRLLSPREIVYRPKPSWRDAVPIEGTRYSQLPETINDILDSAHALVTHGSNACFEAVIAGVPCIILGEAVAKPISSTDIDDIETPRLASDDERRQWLYNLAYQQWSLPEFCSGEAWKVIRPTIYE
jgi:hypothetical protein